MKTDTCIIARAVVNLLYSMKYIFSCWLWFHRDVVNFIAIYKKDGYLRWYLQILRWNSQLRDEIHFIKCRSDLLTSLNVVNITVIIYSDKQTIRKLFLHGTLLLKKICKNSLFLYEKLPWIFSDFLLQFWGSF